MSPATLVVRLRLHVDETNDDAEWFPDIVSFGREHWPHSAGLLTGQTKTAEQAWDLVEAIFGNPAPGKQYRITIEPADDETP